MASTWKPYTIQRQDGSGRTIDQAAEAMLLRYVCENLPEPNGGSTTIPFGIVRMDNGTLIILASYEYAIVLCDNSKLSYKEAVYFKSNNGGDTWDSALIPGVQARPVGLAYLGGGNLTFTIDSCAGDRWFGNSSNHEINWTHSAKPPVPPQLVGHGDGSPGWDMEGNPLVDGNQIAEVEYTCATGDDWRWPTVSYLRRSSNSGQTWDEPDATPAGWLWSTVDAHGQHHDRGVSEGSLIRTTNGWIVAALRTDMLPQFYALQNDQLEGLGVSVSKNNGQSWSQIQILFEAGRHHPSLVCTPDGNIVMTYIVRDDINNGTSVLASTRRGCEAVVSTTNGETWDLDRRYILDASDYPDAVLGGNVCGHTCSTLLGDGKILSAFHAVNFNGQNAGGNAILVRWKP